MKILVNSSFCQKNIIFGLLVSWSLGRLHPIHAKAMNGFYAPFYKRSNL